jgi:hypothetical protein
VITRYCLFLLFLFHSKYLTAQPTIENLKRKLASSANDKDKAKILNELTAQSWDYDFEESLNYARQAYVIAGKLQDPELLTRSYRYWYVPLLQW